jgi:hypothetical protein
MQVEGSYVQYQLQSRDALCTSIIRPARRWGINAGYQGMPPGSDWIGS